MEHPHPQRMTLTVIVIAMKVQADQQQHQATSILQASPLTAALRRTAPQMQALRIGIPIEGENAEDGDLSTCGIKHGMG